MAVLGQKTIKIKGQEFIIKKLGLLARTDVWANAKPMGKQLVFNGEAVEIMLTKGVISPEVRIEGDQIFIGDVEIDEAVMFPLATEVWAFSNLSEELKKK